MITNVQVNSRVSYYDAEIERQLVGRVLRLMDYQERQHAHVRHRYGESLVDAAMLKVMPEPSQFYTFHFDCDCDYCQQCREIFNGGAS